MKFYQYNIILGLKFSLIKQQEPLIETNHEWSDP